MSKKKNPNEYETAFEEAAGKDNPPIDETLLKLIESGDVELTDDLFFQLLRESCSYLNTRPFKDKVTQWTLEGNRKMLNRVQTMLTPEHRGRKSKTKGFEDFEISAAYRENVKIIKDFKEEHHGKTKRVLNKLFQEKYPKAKIDFTKHWSAKELSIGLTKHQYNISERLLRQIIKTTNKTPNITAMLLQRRISLPMASQDAPE